MPRCGHPLAGAACAGRAAGAPRQSAPTTAPPHARTPPHPRHCSPQVKVSQPALLDLFERHKDSKGKQAKLKTPQQLQVGWEGAGPARW
jgi:hypothetical protein